MSAQLLRWLNQNDHWFRFILFIFSCGPGAWLLIAIAQRKLGFNPFETMIAHTGLWAMVFLLITLAITPLRRWACFVCKKLQLKFGKRLADWNFLIKSRRMLGLFSFFYLCWHAGVYLHLELQWDFQWLLEDLQDRQFLWFGFCALAISFTLAITSPTWARRQLGRRWRQLHQGMYLLVLVAVVHVVLEAKVGEADWIYYGVCVAILLMHRLLVKLVARWYREDDDGFEANR